MKYLPGVSGEAQPGLLEKGKRNMAGYKVRKMDGGFGVFDSLEALHSGPVSRDKARELAKGLNGAAESATEAPAEPPESEAPSAELPPVTTHYGAMAKDNFSHLARTAPDEQAREFWQAKADAL